MTAPTISATTNICNNFEPTTVNTDMIIKMPIGYYLEILLHIHYYQVPSLISTRLLNFIILFILVIMLQLDIETEMIYS
ncbi:MAG: hypothetical protein ACKPKO_00640 [Candidatus Fonsibacter sp.]